MKNSRFKRIWNDFWYEWHYPRTIIIGGGPQGYKTFRKQRLFNVIIALIVITISILTFFKK